MNEVQATELRVARASDASDVRAFLGRLSARTLQARYLGALQTMEGPRGVSEAQRLLDGDQRRHVIVVTEMSAHVRGIGEFFIEASGESAELALVVEDNFQGRGIGQLLYCRLEKLARELGIAEFTGDIANGNQLVVSLLRKTGRPLRLELHRGTIRFTLALAA
jgi:GNAT superfamily N-acetyltransferase